MITFSAQLKLLNQGSIWFLILIRLQIVRWIKIYIEMSWPMTDRIHIRKSHSYRSIRQQIYSCKLFVDCFLRGGSMRHESHACTCCTQIIGTSWKVRRTGKSVPVVSTSVPKIQVRKGRGREISFYDQKF